MNERFWSKVDVTGVCWMWTAATNSAGYGVFAITKRDLRLAHRVAYELLVGPIPDGLVLDHLCRTPLCVNPAHLEPVTQRTNLARGVGNQNVGKTHCNQGHLLDESNTYQRPGKGRECITCKRAANRRYKVRRPTASTTHQRAERERSTT